MDFLDSNKLYFSSLYTVQNSSKVRPRSLYWSNRSWNFVAVLVQESCCTASNWDRFTCGPSMCSERRASSA